MILLMNVDKDNPSVAEGESVQIQGAGITGFEPKGNTEQTTYTGKNLFDINSITEGKFYYIDQNRIVGNANWNMSDYIKVNGNTNYIASYIKSTNYSQLNYSYYDENKNLLGGVGASSNTDNYSILTPANAYYIRLGYRNNGDYILSNIQLEQGSTATTFEPYVGGIPSPNPDYPQPVKVVTGNNTIKVEGKNLIPTNASAWEQGTISSSTGANSSSTTRIRTIDYYPIKNDTNYHVSTNANNGRFLNIQLYDNNKSFLGAYYNIDSNISNASDLTINIPSSTYSNVAYMRVVLMNASGTEILPSAITDIKAMIELGTSKTTYQPYVTPQTYPLNLGSIELCKIGTYQDYIYKENNKWYKHSEIGKVVLDGTENWSHRAFPDNSYLSIKMTLNVGENGGFCNYFISDNRYDITPEHMTISKQWKELCFAILKSRLTTEDEAGFKDWLSTNNPIVYYVLATPTNTEITDTELKEDLEAISNIALFEGVNNISMESSNLTSSFKVYYDTWYEFDKILRNGYNIREDRDRITQKFANGHRKQFVSDYVDCSITLNLDTIDKDTTQDYLQRLKSGAYKYYSIDGKEYRTAQFIIENKPELSVENSISNNVDVNEYQITLLKAGD